MSSLRDLVRSILPFEWSEVEGGQVIAPPEVSEPPATFARSKLDDFLARLLEAIAADGVAVAFKQGNEFICRASDGQAPSVGAVLKVGEGLCGMCVQQGRTVVTQKLEGEFCSVVAAPIFTGTRLTGCIAAFSTHTEGFREIDVETLVAVASHLGEFDRPLSTMEKLESLRNMEVDFTVMDGGEDYLARIHGELYPK